MSRTTTKIGRAVDLGDCPWLLRCLGVPGHNPQGICGYGCDTEPECQTCMPRNGWPSLRRLLAEVLP